MQRRPRVLYIVLSFFFSFRFVNIVGSVTRFHPVLPDELAICHLPPRPILFPYSLHQQPCVSHLVNITISAYVVIPRQKRKIYEPVSIHSSPPPPSSLRYTPYVCALLPRTQPKTTGTRDNSPPSHLAVPSTLP